MPCLCVKQVVTFYFDVLKGWLSFLHLETLPFFLVRVLKLLYWLGIRREIEEGQHGAYNQEFSSKKGVEVAWLDELPFSECLFAPEPQHHVHYSSHSNYSQQCSEGILDAFEKWCKNFPSVIEFALWVRLVLIVHLNIRVVTVINWGTLGQVEQAIKFVIEREAEKHNSNLDEEKQSEEDHVHDVSNLVSGRVDAVGRVSVVQQTHQGVHEYQSENRKRQHMIVPLLALVDLSGVGVGDVFGQV